MDISLTKPSALSSSQLDRWREVVRDNPQYDSPFYAPEFTLAVAASRADVELAVVKQGNKLGFLPFQRESRRTGRPVGWKLNDFQGAILPPFMSINPVELLRACGLSIWRFDHLHGAQMWCESAQTVICQSPVINLQEGYKAYLESKRASGDSRLKTVMRKTRKIAREVGDIRLEFDCRDSHVLTSLLRWKSEQLNQSGNSNVFDSSWAVDVVQRLHQFDTPRCQGTLTALYSGSELVAAHFGLRNDRVMHWWLTSFNPEFDRYSPGGVLLLRLSEECAARGITRIDLGKGSEAYKRHFMTGAATVAEGAVTTGGWRQMEQQLIYRITQSVRESRLLNPTVQWVKRVRRQLTRN